MGAPVSRAAGCGLVALLAMFGGCAGLFYGHGHRLPGQPPLQEIHEYPLPHHIPKYEGGVTLRFAMVHDVIHERFPRHGEAYYRERNRLARQGLKERKAAEVRFALYDDLGAGLDYLKQDEEAVELLREKLRHQQQLGQQGQQLYTTYANLGTFLIHGNARAAFSGDWAARDRLGEGLTFIKKSIEVNPSAHFGREVWQAVAAEYLLAVSERPELLLRFDMVGDPLTEEVDPSKGRSFNSEYGFMKAGRDTADFLTREFHDNQGGIRRPEGMQRQAGYLRDYITTVGAGKDWKDAVPSSHRAPVSFDEPALGIIGMWRLGGGANPQFALALAEIMLRVGQRYIAWCAYERASALADRLWPNPDIQRRFAEHCRARQQTIEAQLPQQDVAQLRPRFDAELAYGQHYQRQYQEYEAQRIAAGASLDDPHFYDDFEATREPIASRVGDEDKFVAEKVPMMPYLNWPVAFFAAGVSACLGACFVRLVARWRARRESA
jgi:hypothetical protein